MFREKLEPLWDKIFNSLHRDQGLTRRRRFSAAAFAAARRRALAAVRLFIDHLAASGDSAAKAQVDENIGEMREHLGKMDGVLPSPQLRKALIGLTEDVKSYSPISRRRSP